MILCVSEVKLIIRDVTVLNERFLRWNAENEGHRETYTVSILLVTFVLFLMIFIYSRGKK